MKNNNQHLATIVITDTDFSISKTENFNVADLIQSLDKLRDNLIKELQSDINQGPFKSYNADDIDNKPKWITYLEQLIEKASPTIIKDIIPTIKYVGEIIKSTQTAPPEPNKETVEPITPEKPVIPPINSHMKFEDMYSLSHYLQKALNNQGFKCIADLSGLTIIDLHNLKGFGNNTVAELQNLLKKFINDIPIGSV